MQYRFIIHLANKNITNKKVAQIYSSILTSKHIYINTKTRDFFINM